MTGESTTETTVSRREAASLLGLTERQIDRLTRGETPKLIAEKIDGAVRIQLASVRAWAAERAERASSLGSASRIEVAA